MIYLAIKDNVERKCVNKIIKELGLENDTYDSNEKEDIHKLKKSKIVICDFNTEKIQEYLLLKKIVVVYQKNKIKDKDNILFEKNVYTYNSNNDLREILNYQIRKEKIKQATILGIFILVIILLLVIFNIIMTSNYITKKDKIDESINIQKKEIIAAKNTVNYKRENIVLLGDSITDFYETDRYFKDLPVINSGTSGFQTKDILNLLKERVYIYNPTKVFLLIGTNDIAFTDLTNEELVANIEEIVIRIKKNRPNTKIYVESIYPVNGNTEDNDIVVGYMVGKRENDRIKKVNNLIAEICKKQKVTYIDMYSLLIDEEGNLDLDYTVDGLHISDKGYEIITDKLMSYIDPSTIENIEKK